jgi:glycosyltransferase involved in cell wall biosynthesis
VKILIATIWALPYTGGIWTYVNWLKKGLESRGHQVDILARDPNQPIYRIINKDRCLQIRKVERLIKKKLSSLSLNSPDDNVDVFIQKREIERYCFEVSAAYLQLDEYDLIHAQDIISAKALSRVKPNKTPLVCTVHGSWTDELLIHGSVTPDTPTWHYLHQLTYYGIHSCDAVVIPSIWLRDILVSSSGISKEKFNLIPYGVDKDNLTTGMREPFTFPPIPKEKTIILCSARLDRVKGHRYLLYALKKLKRERDDWICWIVGEGYLKKKLNLLCNKLRLNQHVLFLGNRVDIPALLNKADIFVLPSLLDNQPFALIEAQIAGKTVLVTDAGGIPEMVIDNCNALVSPTRDSKALYRNFKKVLEDEQLRKRLADNAKQWGQTEWSLDKMVDRMINLYNKLLNNGS